VILAGDIGGTHARLALYDDAGRTLAFERTYENAEHTDPEAVLTRFREDAGRTGVRAAALAIAGPVLGGRVRMTNLAWTFDEAALSAFLGGTPVRLLNDLEAAAYGVLVLAPGDFRELAAGAEARRGNAVVIAAGTGLGEALVGWHGDVPVALASEGGHADFAPEGETELALLAWLRRTHPHVSWEHVVSGPGVVAVYEFLRDSGRAEEPAALRARLAAASDRGAVITAAAIAGEHPICEQALGIFVRCYGAEAGNLALKGLATGGVYVAGGIAPHVLQGPWADRFVAALVAKGRYEELLRRVPVRVVLSGGASLVGSASVAARLAG
jgi:glucokinase